MKTDTIALIAFFILGAICLLLAWLFTAYEGTAGFTITLAAIACICFLIGLWCKSDFHRWK